MAYLGRDYKLPERRIAPSERELKSPGADEVIAEHKDTAKYRSTAIRDAFVLAFAAIGVIGAKIYFDADYEARQLKAQEQVEAPAVETNRTNDTLDSRFELGDN